MNFLFLKSHNRTAPPQTFLPSQARNLLLAAAIKPDGNSAEWSMSRETGCCLSTHDLVTLGRFPPGRFKFSLPTCVWHRVMWEGPGQCVILCIIVNIIVTGELSVLLFNFTILSCFFYLKKKKENDDIVMVLFWFAFNKTSGNTHCRCSKSIFILIKCKECVFIKNSDVKRLTS